MKFTRIAGYIFLWLLRIALIGAVAYLSWHKDWRTPDCILKNLWELGSMLSGWAVLLWGLPWLARFPSDIREATFETAWYVFQEFSYMIWEVECTTRERLELISRRDEFLRRLPKWVQRRLKAAKQKEAKS